MSQEGLSMRKIEEILRLKYEAGLSHRTIVRWSECGFWRAYEAVNQKRLWGSVCNL
jgi:hypothetical protein